MCEVLDRIHLEYRSLGLDFSAWTFGFGIGFCCLGLWDWILLVGLVGLGWDGVRGCGSEGLREMVQGEGMGSGGGF